MLPPECKRAAADLCDCFVCFPVQNPTVKGLGARALEAASEPYGHPTRRDDKHIAGRDSEMCGRVRMGPRETRKIPCPERYRTTPRSAGKLRVAAGLRDLF